MVKQFWINLPVKDINKSIEFFSKIGFSIDTQYGNTAESANLVIGDKGVVVMLFTESMFKNFARNEIIDSQQATEVLLSFDAESREEVDEITKKAVEAGGTIFGEPGDNGWMYGSGFADLDGHRWNVLYMDMSKMPKD